MRWNVHFLQIWRKLFPSLCASVSYMRNAYYGGTFKPLNPSSLTQKRACLLYARRIQDEQTTVALLGSKTLVRFSQRRGDNNIKHTKYRLLIRCVSFIYIHNIANSSCIFEPFNPISDNIGMPTLNEVIQLQLRMYTSRILLGILLDLFGRASHLRNREVAHVWHTKCILGFLQPPQESMESIISRVV